MRNVVTIDCNIFVPVDGSWYCVTTPKQLGRQLGLLAEAARRVSRYVISLLLQTSKQCRSRHCIDCYDYCITYTLSCSQ